MDNKTVHELCVVAKQRGLSGYSKLRKTELIALLSTLTKLLLEPVPDMQVAPIMPGPISITKKVYDKIKSTINIYADWIINYVPKEPKRVARNKVLNLSANNLMIKFNLVLYFEMEHVNMKSECVINTVASFLSNTKVVLEATSIGELYSKAFEKIMESMAMFQMRGSHWRFKTMQRLEINTVAYKPVKGELYIPLPPVLENKKVIVNMKNEDDQCFKWCMTQALNPVDHKAHPYRETKELRKQAENLNWTGIDFLFAVNENIIGKFERNNNLSVNVFGYNTLVYPLYMSRHQNKNVVDLLFIFDAL